MKQQVSLAFGQSVQNISVVSEQFSRMFAFLVSSGEGLSLSLCLSRRGKNWVSLILGTATAVFVACFRSKMLPGVGLARGGNGLWDY